MSKPIQLFLQVPESPRLILTPASIVKSTAASQSGQQPKPTEVPVRLYLTVKR